MSASNEGKTLLYIWLVLEELTVPQDCAMVLFEENKGTVDMSNANHPTQQAQHMDIKFFLLLDWVESDLLLLEPIKTARNPSDLMTKLLGYLLFHQHVDVLMGRIMLDWVPLSNDLCVAYALPNASNQ